MDGLRELGSRLVERLFRAAAWLWREARLVVDAQRFRSAASWRDRLNAVSWSRAGAAGGGLAALALMLGVGIWLVQSGTGSHPPRLPTDVEWRAAQSAERAMESDDLSPALAAANRSVTP